MSTVHFTEYDFAVDSKMDVDGDENVTDGEFLAVCFVQMGVVSMKDCR